MEEDLDQGAQAAVEQGGDLAQQYIRRMDAERAAWVAKRRQSANPLQRAFAYVVPYGSILSSGLNLASSTIGAGIISLPSAFATSGVIMAFIYLVIIAGLSVYSYTLIGSASRATGLCNYEQMVRALMGRGADIFLAILMMLLSLGAEISYAISLKNVTTQFLTSASNVPAYLTTAPGERLITSALWFVFMLPLCLPKEINSLRYFSFIAILFIIFFVICMIIHAAHHGLKGGLRDDLVLFQSGNTAVYGLGIFIFAFGNQINAAEVLRELYQPTVKRFTMSALVATVLCFILYSCAGLFGYFDFGPTVNDKSSLQLYDPIQEPLMGVAYVGIMLKLCVGYGLHMQPIRDAVYHMAHTDVHEVPWWLNSIVCSIIATITLIGGLFIPKVNLVFGLMGAFCSGFIAFVFPAFMYMYTGNWHLHTVGWFHFFATFTMLIVGIIGIVWGTAATIYGDAIP
ncbi:amino acid permease [Strigomonas culicis]|uniref:Amino acid permease n=1 Tax=Strigomonas culicis TaxID=28005 RepID=S9V3F0_9TRYP|nr:amino acid permease [Strigomonas culicis]|eukprot:EPY21446.1 amino acid permease [Strigomonas culicis]